MNLENKPTPMLVEIVAIYQTALNRIDDYFDYSYGANRDKAFVSGLLNKLYKDTSVIAYKYNTNKYNTKLEK